MSLGRDLRRRQFTKLKKLTNDEVEDIVRKEGNEFFPAHLLRGWVKKWRKRNDVPERNSGESS